VSEDGKAESKIKVAIVGSGNIGTDLMYKLLEEPGHMELMLVAGVEPESEGLKRARDEGIETTYEGIQPVLDDPKIKIVFEATSAKAHVKNAPKYKEAGKIAVDLTPAAQGPYVVPVANLTEHLDEDNVNLMTCGAQATTPMAYAISRITPVRYAEMVSTVASLSAGPGTRQNIDEFTRTTAGGVETIGGAQQGKAIIILNPAEPPMIMRDTIFCAVGADADREAITESVHRMVASVQEYVPGYRLLQEPQFDDPSPATRGATKVSVFIEVEGAGDFLPSYSGNLDIMTAAATRAGEGMARKALA
jgi:acetaldehyde dehydrogenase